VQSDAQLWAASAAGSREAFVALVERHEAAVCAVTYALTGDRSLSEDLAQEAFIVAWTRRCNVREPERFAAWLCGIARNLCRKAHARMRAPSALPAHELPEDELGPEGRLAQMQLRELVWSTLSSLPPIYREPLVLYYRAGKSAQEVADRLGLPPATVDQRLSRGRKLLRAEMERLLEDELQRTGPRNRVRDRVAAALPALSWNGAPGTSNAILSPFAGVLVKKLFAIVIIVLVGIGAWIATRPSTEPATGHASAPRPDHVPAGRSGDTATHGDDALARIHGQHEALANEPEPTVPHRPLPENYELSRLGNRVTVNLDGGPSRMYAYGISGDSSLLAVDPTPELVEKMKRSVAAVDPPATRTVTGIVLDADGAAVRGALVLTDVRFGELDGERYAVGTDGTATGADGRFELSALAGEGVSIMAISDDGWSDLAQLPAGSANADVELRLAPRTRLRGRVTRAATGHPATVAVLDADVRYEVSAALDGTFEVDPIAPGTYQVTAAAEDGRQAQSSRSASAEVVVEAGDDAVVELELPTGTIVAVSLELSPAAFPAGLHVRLARGARAAQVHDLPSFLGLSDGDAVVAETVELLRDEASVAEPIEFTDSEPGSYTACAVLYRMKPDDVGATQQGEVGFAFDHAGTPVCAEVLVGENQPLVELTLRPGHHSPAP